MLCALAAKGDIGVVERVLGDHLGSCDSIAVVDVVLQLLKRREESFDALAVQILQRHGDSSIEATICEQAEHLGESVVRYFLERRKIRTLEKLAERPELTRDQAAALHGYISGDARTLCEAALTSELSERQAIGAGVNNTAFGVWVRRDGRYAQWVVQQPWFAERAIGMRPSAYLPQHIDDFWAGHFAQVIEHYTNYESHEREYIIETLQRSSRHRVVDAAVIKLWGAVEAKELDAYMFNTYMRSAVGEDSAWTSFRRLFSAIGHGGEHQVWADEPTLAVALQTKFCRHAALRSPLLSGSDLEKTYAAIIASGDGLDAAALCANPNLTGEQAEALARRASGPGTYLLHRAPIGAEARASLLLRETGLVEAVHLMYRSCVVAGQGLGEIEAWFRPEVALAYTNLHNEGGRGGDRYSMYINIVLEMHPEQCSTLALAASMESSFCGKIAEAVAAELAETSNPDAISGLLMRWKGTVGQLLKAAEKI